VGAGNEEGKFMRHLSISAAWDEAKAIIAHDGGLLMTVALALVALPAAVNSFVNPSGMNGSATPLWVDGVAFVASLIALAGQLALIRLALGPSVTVGSAIGHGFRRMPVYLVAILIIVFGLVLLIVVLAVLLAAAGVHVQRDATQVAASPASVIVALLVLGIMCFFGVRLILAGPVASAERLGPIGVLRRSWALTAGNGWPLFGFLLIFIVGAIIVLFAIASALGAVIGLLTGHIQPMSAAALVLALLQSLVSAGITTVFAVMLARIYLQLSGGGEAQVGVPSSGT
jgi:hypothetical protein